MNMRVVGEFMRLFKTIVIFVSTSLAFVTLCGAEVKSITIAAGSSMGSAESIRGMRLTLPNVPSWLTVLPTSLLGPQELFPGESYSFRLDFEVEGDSVGVQQELELWVTQENTNVLPVYVF